MAIRQPNDASLPPGRDADTGSGQPAGAPGPAEEAPDREERVTERIGRVAGAGPAGDDPATDRTAEISDRASFPTGPGAGTAQPGGDAARSGWVAAAPPEPSGWPHHDTAGQSGWAAAGDPAGGTGRAPETGGRGGWGEPSDRQAAGWGAGQASGVPPRWSSASQTGTAAQPQAAAAYGPGSAGQEPGSGARPGWGDAPSPPSGPSWGDGPPSGPSWQTAPISGSRGWDPASAPAGGAAGGRGRSVARTLLALVAAVGLLLTGAGLNRLADRNEQPTASSGVPVASPGAPVQTGQEPAAAVARSLGPSVVQLETGDGLGSGVIYDKNGFILTAAHVTEGSQSLTVRLFDGTALRGRVVGADQGNDIAVVKVDRTDLRPAKLALGADLQVGQMAVAIGSPFGLEQTVTVGVVSAKQRSLRTQDGGGLEVIQTDAPINPGNSGGALADRLGRVIGINDSIRSESGGNEGVGFAVPIDTAANSAARIVKGEPIRSGYLGVSLDTPSLGRAGALVNRVDQGSPAEQSGLEVGDLIVQFGGRSIQSSDDLAAQIRSVSPGQRIPVKVVREGKEQAVTVMVGQRPASSG
ncbi:MAG TPA: trypsin-like peptidase domain-containing protein [Actinomycetota bacterium]|nr:trypsin-like peptidase domain-containing protein [Actinomycetota bacterium]